MFLSVKNNTLTIQRSENLEIFKICPSREITCKIHGVFGIIIFNNIQYLVIIKESNVVGKINGFSVHEIKKVLIYILEDRHKIKNSIEKYLYEFFKIPGIYFSEYKLYGQANNDFLFNNVALENYHKSYQYFGLYCIQGYVEIYKNLILISRRSYKRCGTRYFSRGCNNEGHCSNFVETIQILGNTNFIQIRGSIPFLWKHKVNYKYSPEIIIDNNLIKMKILIISPLN